MSGKRTALSILIGMAIITLVYRDNRAFGQSESPEQSMRVPAYHATGPRSLLSPVLSPARFHDNVTRNAYLLAGKIPEVLYQAPCYCYCDRSHGHKSLHDCFMSTHGASCSVCQREVFYSYEQHKRGKTLLQIRKGIMAADWADIDISLYQKKLPRE